MDQSVLPHRLMSIFVICCLDSLISLYLEPSILSQTILNLQFYLYSIGKIVNKQWIVYDRIPGSRYSFKMQNFKTPTLSVALP